MSPAGWLARRKERRGLVIGSIRDAYEQAIKLYNAGDLDGFANSYTEDAALMAPPRGLAAIREQWGRGQAAFPDRTVTEDVIIEQDDAISTEFTWAGTNTGPLVLPDGTELPSTGKRVETKGMELMRVRGCPNSCSTFVTLQ